MLPVSMSYKEWQKDAVTKEHLAFKRMGCSNDNREDVIFKIVSSELQTGMFTNEFSYDPLQDHHYQERLNYYPASTKDRLSLVNCPSYELRNGRIEVSHDQKDCFDIDKRNKETKLAAKCQLDYVRFALNIASLSQKESKKAILTHDYLVNKVYDLQQSKKLKPIKSVIEECNESSGSLLDSD
jgi:hypothetical protein